MALVNNNDETSLHIIPLDVIEDRAEDEVILPPWGLKLFMLNAGVVVVCFLHALDTVIPVHLQTVMGDQLGYAEALPWISAGMGAFALALPIGKLYVIGNKRAVFIFCYINYLCGVAICGGTPTMTGAIVGRVWAAIGSTGMRIGLFYLVEGVMPRGNRSVYQIASVFSWAVAFALGSFIGMLGSSWRWAFYTQLIVSIGVLPPMIMRLPPGPARTAVNEHLDTVGTMFSSVPIVLFTIASVYAGIVDHWMGPTVVLLFTIGGILTLAFMLQQVSDIFATAQERHLNVSQLRNREPALRFALVGLSTVVAWIVIFYYPFYLYAIRGGSPTETARDLLTFVIALIVALISMGVIHHKPGYYRCLYIFAVAVGVIGCVFMSLPLFVSPPHSKPRLTDRIQGRMGAEDSKAGVYACGLMLGVTAGCIIHAGLAAYQPESDPGGVTPSISMKLLSHLAGSWFGACVGGAIYMTTAKAGLRALFPDLSAEARDSLVLGTAGHFLADLGPTDRKLALELLAGGLKKVWYPAMVASGLSVVLAMLVQVCLLARLVVEGDVVG
ncbi:hypothetical protein XA68_11100 [Ophiocordyceps unilateralis]|uniref:Major facilitator superfamily (MFS) profile domain-containing protein n=1 Tax=Ophiocordyceps unilateralis TaxID=268505 RepID=A0A2A9PG92_OPHUN|nr:hypothetical protein XA68_11100 [Ophiocordyceps unilateralis]